MIYTFNNVGYVLYSLTKDCFDLTDKQVYNMIQQEFEKMKSRLKQKGIDYNDLKKALIPNTVESRHELCLLFDRTLIEDTNKIEGGCTNGKRTRSIRTYVHTSAA